MSTGLSNPLIRDTNDSKCPPSVGDMDWEDVSHLGTAVAAVVSPKRKTATHGQDVCLTDTGHFTVNIFRRTTIQKKGTLETVPF